MGKPSFSDQFKKIIKRYKRVGYKMDIMRQSACLVEILITVYSYGFLFNCTIIAFIVFQMFCYCKCPVALTHCAVGGSAGVIVVFPDHTHPKGMYFIISSTLKDVRTACNEIG